MSDAPAPGPLRRFLTDPERRPWLFAAAAVATRLAAALTTVVIHPDSARYFRMATLMGEGSFGEALRIWPMSHPLYALFIALGEAATGNAALAAVAISAALGGLAVVPLHAMTRAAWGGRVAAIAALLYVFLPDPVELHGFALPEGPFYFFFFATMALSWSALERKSWERAVLAGACAAGAWLARPEGIYLPLLFLFAGAWRPRRFTIAAAGIFFATAFLLAFPYLAFLRAHAGKWTVSAIPITTGVLGLLTGETKPTGYQVDEKSAREFGEYRYVADYGKVLGPVLYIGKTVSRNLFQVLTPFLLIGLVFLRTPETRWGPASHLVVAGIGYAIPPCLAFVAAATFSYRYLLPAMTLLLPVVAVGIVKATSWVKWKHALPFFLIAVFAAMTVKFMRPKMADKITLKDAGTAIAVRMGPGQRILGTRGEVAYYARGEFFAIEAGGKLEDVLRQIRERKIGVITLFEPDLRNCAPGLREHVEKEYEFLGAYPLVPRNKADPMRVYLVKSR